MRLLQGLAGTIPKADNSHIRATDPVHARCHDETRQSDRVKFSLSYEVGGGSSGGVAESGFESGVPEGPFKPSVEPQDEAKEDSLCAGSR